MKHLQEKREELEKKLKRMEEAHYKKPYWHNESSYQDSCKAIHTVYKELFEVAQELGAPIPVRF